MTSKKETLIDEKFYKVPLSVLSDFINTFLSIFFHPLKFFSSNYFF